jgi:hypothetical protein
MRGRQDAQITMPAFVDLEERVALDHPIRTIKRFADRALDELSPIFDQMYAVDGRPSIPPERLHREHLRRGMSQRKPHRALCVLLACAAPIDTPALTRLPGRFREDGSSAGRPPPRLLRLPHQPTSR